MNNKNINYLLVCIMIFIIVFGVCLGIISNYKITKGFQDKGYIQVQKRGTHGIYWIKMKGEKEE